MKTKISLLVMTLLLGFQTRAQVCSSFQAKYSTIDSANVIKFIDSSNVSPNATNVTYYIKWGDGNVYQSSTKPGNMTHVYPTTGGNFTMCFKITGYMGTTFCSDSSCKNIFICPIINPSVANTVSSSCGNPCSGSIYFTGLKPNTVHYIRSWTFNNIFQTFTSLYTLNANANGAAVITGLCPGTYQNIQIWTGNFNCVIPVSGFANIGQSSTLNANFVINHIAPPNAGKMRANVTGGKAPFTFQWSNNLSNKDTMVTTQPGLYCVTVTDSVGCKKILCDSLLLQANTCSGTPNVQPLLGPDSACANSLTTFYVNMLNTVGFQYLWQTSNDSVSWVNAGSSNMYATITAPTSGCLFIRVKVLCTNSNLWAYSPVKKLCVKNCSGGIKACDTLGNITYTKVCNQFNFEAKNAPAGYTMTYSWYFSNNTTAQGRTVSKTFANGGYFAKLYYCVKNSNQVVVCCDSSMITFTAGCTNNNPCADVKAKFVVSTSGANAIFTDSSKCPVGMALTYNWSFGNGATSSLKNPTHVYATPGTYTVRLIITGWYNNSTLVCRDTFYKVVQITVGNPCAKLIPSFTFVQTGNSFNFTNTSTYNGLGKVGVSWNFGDGSTSTLPNPTKAYTSAGSYFVTMTVTAYDTPTQTTCVKSFNMWVQSSNSPCAGFDARFTFVKNFLNINFTNTTVGANANTTYKWFFGNGATSTATSPNYTYPLPGLYRVVLKAKMTLSSGGICEDSAVYFINVNTSNPCKDSGYVSYYNYQCGTYLSPLCGCDGITYANYCEAAKAGVKQYTQGPCANDTTYVKICGWVYNDLNYNCAKDTMDKGVNGIQIKLTGAGGTFITYTNYQGYYQFYAPKGSYSVMQNLSSSNWYNNNLNLKQMCPAANGTIAVNAPVAGTTYCNNNFFDTLRNCLDLAISISRFRNITPGFNRMVYLNYKNNSPFAVNNVKVYFKKNTVQTFVSSVPAASGSSGNQYFWNIGTLNANQSGQIKIELFTPTSVALGTLAYDTAWIVPDTADCEKGNNRASLRDTCKGSWDPNDKAVSPQGEGEKGNIVKETRTLDYLVRFQNKGTAPAFNIKVEDQLDANLDWRTLKVHGVSHPYSVFMDDAGKLIFEFRDIMLPDENTDEEGSQGFINYSIDLKDNLAIGTEIKNTAAIYFDFNDPVITNTTINTIAEKTSGIIDVNHGQLDVVLYPNPVKDVANFMIHAKADDLLHINITDISGKTVRTLDIQVKEGNQVNTIPLRDLSNGMYLVHIATDKQQTQTFKMIKE